VKWLEAFLFTQAVEIPIWVWALRRAARREGARERPSFLAALLIAFGASAITHPIVWFGFPYLRPSIGYWPMVACAEAFAVGVEAAYMRGEGMRRAWLWSLVANGASFGLGILILWRIWAAR
jgi:hypothetical protein